MTRTIDFPARKNGRVRRDFAIILISTAVIYGLLFSAAEARMLREVMPPVQTERMPTTHRSPQIPVDLRPMMSSIQTNLGGAALRSRGGRQGFSSGGGGGSVGGSSRVTTIEPDLDTLKKQKEAADKKKKDAAKKLADLENDFLKSKAGKDAKKKIDEEKKKRDAKKKQAREDYYKRLGELGPNCCGLGEKGKEAGKLLEDEGKADDEYEEAKKNIIEDEMKKSDPKKAKDYKKAQDDVEKAKKDSAKAQKKLDAAKQKEWDKADMDWPD